MSTQLNTLLRLRQYEVDRCQSQLAAAILVEQALKDRLYDIDRQREQQRAELSTFTCEGQLNIDALRRRQQHLQHLNEQQSAVRAEFESAAEVTLLQRATLVAADQRRQVIEKLRARQLQEVQQQVRRADARELDEASRALS